VESESVRFEVEGDQVLVENSINVYLRTENVFTVRVDEFIVSERAIFLVLLLHRVFHVVSIFMREVVLVLVLVLLLFLLFILLNISSFSFSFSFFLNLLLVFFVTEVLLMKYLLLLFGDEMVLYVLDL
jgi:hypothetical protein